MDSHGKKYFISFIDDFSRYMYLYILHNKNEALDALKVFKAEVEKQCGKQIKIVRSDKGGEYYGRYLENGQALGPFANLRGYKFYCPFHNTRIVESRNAKFLEYDLVNGSDQFRNIVSDIDHTESQPSIAGDRLFVVHNTSQVQTNEMSSMRCNDVWDLVELPNGAKAIGCKWVFKTKKDSLGNIERYKARLVAKGFT
ncbi:hypothetical protein AAG906_039869 [Vitis piasezkii]